MTSQFSALPDSAIPCHPADKAEIYRCLKEILSADDFEFDDENKKIAIKTRP